MEEMIAAKVPFFLRGFVTEFFTSLSTEERERMTKHGTIAALAVREGNRQAYSAAVEAMGLGLLKRQLYPIFCEWAFSPTFKG